MLRLLLVLQTAVPAASRCAGYAEAVTAALPGNRAAALDAAGRVSRECRNDFDALYTAGRALNRAAVPERSADRDMRLTAQRLLDRATQLRPRNAAAWLEYGLNQRRVGGLQIDAQRAIRRALDLADRYPDSVPPTQLAEMHFVRGRYLQDELDRMRWLKDANPIGVTTPACVGQGAFCENYTRPTEFNNRLKETPALVGDYDEKRRLVLQFLEGAVRLDSSNLEALERYARELALGAEWERLEAVARRAENNTALSPGVVTAVRALAVTQQGRLRQADSLYRRAIPQLSDSLRRWFERPPPGLDTLAHFWDRARPLWVVPYNELQVEHWTRVTYSQLVLRDREVGVMGPETPQGDALLRYGWPAMITQVGRDAARYVAGNSFDAAQAYLACTGADAGGDAAACDPGPQALVRDESRGRWMFWTYSMDRPSLMFEQRGGARVASYLLDASADQYAAQLRAASPLVFRSKVTPKQFRLPLQVTRFRGANADQTTVFLHALVATEQLGLPPQDSVDVGLFLFSDGPGFAPVAERRASYAAGTGIGLSYQVPLAAGRYAFSLEALAEGYGAAATIRDTLVAPRWTPESLLISDLWVAHQVTPRVDGEPVAVRDLVVEPSRTLEVAPGTRVWVVWEAYGLSPDERGNGTYQVTLTLQDAAQRSLPVRALRRLGVGAPQEAARLEWQSVRRLSADGRALEYVELELPGAGSGEYRLAVTVRAGARETTATRRLVVVVPEPAPR